MALTGDKLIKHMEDLVGHLKRFSDGGRYMRQPGLSSGSCYELAVELEAFIDSYKDAIKQENVSDKQD